jgi:hypothetical protein
VDDGAGTAHDGVVASRSRLDVPRPFPGSKRPLLLEERNLDVLQPQELTDLFGQRQRDSLFAKRLFAGPQPGEKLGRWPRPRCASITLPRG